MSREHEHEIEIDATPQEVWRALTEPDQLTKWFADEAIVEPREGGRHRIAWTPEMAAEAIIETWEPGARLRLVSASDDGMPGAEQLVEEFTIEVRGHRTVLRLIHSGFGDDPRWDDFFDGTNAGWDAALVLLRYVAERALDRTVTGKRFYAPTALSSGEGWRRVLDLLGTKPDGARYATTTALGDAWEGEVLFARAPAHDDDICSLAITVNDDALFTVGLERMGGGTFAGGGLLGVGTDPDPRYEGALREALGL